MNVGVDLKIYYEYFKYFPGFFVVFFFYNSHFQRINDLCDEDQQAIHVDDN